jgi:DNA-directed RNA polymerase subunit beta'
VIVGRLIPAGTGLTYHASRRRNASGLTESEMEALVSAPAEVAAPVAVVTVADVAVDGTEE